MTTSQIETLRDTINDALQVITNASKQINQAPDPYAELKKAHAVGKVIQCRPKIQSKDWHSVWQVCENPMWLNHSDYRLKPEEPWTLPRQLPGFRALRDGEEWHFADKWKKEWLPAGTRPLLVGEDEFKEDKVVFFDGEIVDVYKGKGTKPKYMQFPRRTKRPLPILTPEQIADGWKEWHGGQNPVPGKRVVIMCRDFEIPEWQIKGVESKFVCWDHIQSDEDIIAYRVIEPKLVPLGPDDVLPGSAIKHKLAIAPDKWWQALSSGDAGVTVLGSSSSVVCVMWDRLMREFEINRSIPLTGKWDATAWEPCSKPCSKEGAE